MSERYVLAPQMKDYEKLGMKWSPYIMFISSPEYSSETVNTDKYGLRYTEHNFNKHSISNQDFENPTSIITGGSTAFGVGCTNDKFTLSSLLSKKCGHTFLNFGGRAYNSKQEFILFTNFVNKFKNLRNVILFSGANNLYVSSFDEKHSFPFFFSSAYESKMNETISSRTQMILKFLLEPIYKDTINYSQVRLNELIKIIFSKSFKNIFFKKKSNIINIEKAIYAHYSDLFLWKCLSKELKFRLIFALQPMPGWCNKNLTKEEKIMFELLDSQNKILKQMNTQKTYFFYKEELEKSCDKLDIEMIDLNKLFYENKDWLFVDRVHLTNLGYELIADRLSKL